MTNLYNKLENLVEIYARNGTNFDDIKQELYSANKNELDECLNEGGISVIRFYGYFISNYTDDENSNENDEDLNDEDLNNENNMDIDYQVRNERYIQLLKLFLDLGLDLDEPINLYDLMMLFIKHNEAIEIIKFIHSIGKFPKDEDFEDYDIMHPLINASSCLFGPEYMSTLCELGLNINYIANDGTTPLSKAVSQYNLEAVKMLLNYGAKVNDDDNNSLALIMAVKEGNFEIIKLLVNYKANINTIYTYGNEQYNMLFTFLLFNEEYRDEYKDREYNFEILKFLLSLNKWDISEERNCTSFYKHIKGKEKETVLNLCLRTNKLNFHKIIFEWFNRY